MLTLDIDHNLFVAIPIWNDVVVDRVYMSYPVVTSDHKLLADLNVISMKGIRHFGDGVVVLLIYNNLFP